MKKFFKSNNFGISLMECMIVIIIIGIMLLIWRFTSRGHIRIAIANEGRAFVEKVVAQERIYRANHSNFDFFSTTRENSKLNINTNDNKYFSTFSVDNSKGSFRVVVYGTDGTKASGVQIIGIYNTSTNGLTIEEHGL